MRVLSLMVVVMSCGLTLAAADPCKPVQRDNGAEGGPLKRHRETLAQIAAAKEGFDIALLGDSITYNSELTGAMQKLRKSYSVLNLGVCGDKTENVLWRCDHGELDGYKVKCVQLMIGTNNGGAAPKDIARAIKLILKRIEAKQPQAKVLLLSIPPRGRDASDPQRQRNEQVNRLIKSFADGKKVIWCDFTEKWFDEKGELIGMNTDLLHPNGRAYMDIWLPSVMPHFEAICGKR